MQQRNESNMTTNWETINAVLYKVGGLAFIGYSFNEVDNQAGQQR